MQSHLKYCLIIICSVILTACGGGSGGGSTATQTGQFKDSNVAGVQYITASNVGTTNALGEFNYQDGEVVEFKIGSLSLGSTTASALITPVDLAGDGVSGARTLNIVRLLTTLDADGNWRNGITIDGTFTTLVSSIPFNFATNIGANASFTAALRFISRVLPTPRTITTNDQARAHLFDTLVCSFAGGFTGTYQANTDTNTDLGRMVALIGAENNATRTVHIVTYDYATRAYAQYAGVMNSYGREGSFTASARSPSGSGTLTFTGRYLNPTTVSGSWSDTNTSSSGRFNMQRRGNLRNAKHRYIGVYNGSDYGLYTLDLDASNNIDALIYSIGEDGIIGISSQAYNSATGNFNVTFDSGATATGTIDIANRRLSGTWSNTTVSSAFGGNISGSGCQLN